MDEYIKREDAIKAIIENPSKIGVFTAKAIRAIEDLPTADVVEVARCKDCKHYKRHKPPIEDFDGWCSVNEIECDTDFYCQYGSMKGGRVI